MAINKELAEMIAEWLYHNDKMREINKYLFDNTQLYEQKYMTEFKDEIFRFFAGKITRYSKDLNNLYKILTQEEKQQLNKARLLRK